MDPIKEMMTQGASQFGMMNTQFAQGIATALTQGVSQLNMMASSMTAAVPDLGAAAPAGFPGFPGSPMMGQVSAPAAAPVQTFAPAYKPRMIR